MKRHAIIPIFIPHRGCPNDCVFCNQRKITAVSAPVTEQQVRDKIETWLTTLHGRQGLTTVEIAFYGGSFTGIPMEEQTAFLTVAKEYKDRGLVDKLHLSTRPDYIDERILENLKRLSVDVIELGVQSFDEEVLRLSNRGHGSAVVGGSARLIREFGFTLGIQLMIGLPGDSFERCMDSVEATIALQPEIARLYPTVVIRDTELYRRWEQGTYEILPQEEMVCRTAAMYRKLTEAGIQVIRVGLKSSELIDDGAETAPGTFHPAFRQLVCGRLAREDLERQLEDLALDSDGRKVSFYASGDSMSDMIGWRGENRTYFAEKYPQLRLRFERDDSLLVGCFACREKSF